MGLFSSSKSKSKSYTYTTNKQRQVSLNAPENEGQVVSAGGNVTMLDGGSIDRAFMLGQNAIDEVSSFGMAAIRALSDDNEARYTEHIGTVQAVAEASRAESTQQMDKLIKYFFMALAFSVAAAAYVKKG